jgi:transposase
MGRERVGFSEQQLLELHKAALGSRDGARRSRYQAVWLYGQGYAVQEIERIVGCSRSSLMEWCRSYRRAGVAGLVDGRRGGNRARLSVAQLAALHERLHTLTPAALFGAAAQTPDGQYWSIADLQRALEQWYGVRYSSRGSYHRLMHHCGFSYQRTAKVYKSRSERQIAAFEEALEKN